MFSISAGFKKDKGFLAAEDPAPLSNPPEVPPPSKGTPSTTNRGLFPALIEPVPLMFILIPAPGSPLAGVI